VIDATGRAAVLAAQLGARRLVFDRLVGVVGLARLRPGENADTRTLVEADADGWWYSARIPGSRLVICYLTDADLLPRGAGPLRTWWDARLHRCPHTRGRCERGEVEGNLAIVATRSQRLEPAAGPGWCTVGDAAMTFDPLSSQGITKALASGLAAARNIIAGRAEEVRLAEFADCVREEFEGYLRTRQAIYGREQRWRDSPFWSRRQGHAAGTARHGDG
jgi:flavin-dependent dehydrogenase